MIHDQKKHSRSALRFAVWFLIVGGLVTIGFPVPAATNLFTSGVGGYNTYRIPALYETTNGTLLAFCEGRVNSSSDTGNIDTLLRRSFDGGATWTAQQVIWSDGANTCGNPTVLQDSSNGRIWLFLTWNNGNDSQSEIQNGTSIDVRKIYSCYSDNDGATWSAPLNRFAEVQPSDIRWDATGPGRGIQIVNGAYPGRLVIPANGRNIQSDNHGATWSQSAWLPGGSSESQEVEVSGGVLLRNDRATGGNAAYNARVFCQSTNQGSSWNALQVRQDLVCPICMASTIAVAHPNGLNGRMLVFSNPSSTTRDHMTIKCSLDDGVTWPFSHLVYAGSAAYSCLTTVGMNNIGLLYERDGYGRITFEKFAYSDLVPNSPTNQPVRRWSGSAGPGNESWLSPANWETNALPVFDNGLDVIFATASPSNLTNCLGGNLTMHSLAFTTSTGGDVKIFLAEKITSPATNFVLTFDSYLGNATNSISAGLSRNIVIGAGGSGGVGSLSLAANLVVDHNGSGTLTYDRPFTEASTGMSLIKNGNGTVVLGQSNSYSGGTFLNAGTLLLGAASNACGSGPMVLNNGTVAASSNTSRTLPNNLTVAGSVTLGQLSVGTGPLKFTGSLDLDGDIQLLTINVPVELSGAVSNGALSKNGPGLLTLSGANTYSGQTILYSGTLQLGNGGSTGGLDGGGSIAIGPGAFLQYNRTNNLSPFSNNLSGSGVLVKTNIGELGLTGTNVFSGLIDVQQGKLGLSGASCVNGMPSVNIGTNGILSLGSGFLGGTARISNLTGSGRIDPVYGQGTAVRTLQVFQNVDASFSGIIADGSSGRVLAFTKDGPAMLTLSASNSYSGPTVVSNGLLVINGTLSNSAVTIIESTLGGTGYLARPVNVLGGTLWPGAGNLGTMTINSTLTLDAGSTVKATVDASVGQSARIAGLASVSFAGTLLITNIAGTLSIGQTFQVFSMASAGSGNFATVVPNLPNGKGWSFNPTNGVLSVVSKPALPPTNLTFAAAGSVVSLSWPPTHLGWVVQSNAVGVLNPTGWFDLPNSENGTSLQVEPDPALTNVYYRLRAP